MRFIKAFSVIILIIMLVGCSNENEANTSKTTSTTTVNDTIPASKEFFAMDTYMEVDAYGDNGEKAVAKAEKEVNKLDSILSTGKSTSEIRKLNKNKKQVVSADTMSLIKESVKISKETNSAFNPTIYPLMELWGFTTKNYYVPKDNEIKTLLNHMDIDNIKIDERKNEVSFKDSNMKIDLGAIAKGYTSSKIIDIFKENNIKNGMVTLGGNVQVLGKKPDGSLWKVGIQNPIGEDEYLGVLQTSDKAVITSGGYERNFTKNGKTYHHILDPSNGYPANNGLTSVTIISSYGTLADALSTSLFVMGKDKAIDFYKKSNYNFDFILYTSDNKLIISDGIKDIFSSDLDIKVVNK
ncbi:MAG TPA: FAD:protein FMN transferase [Ruminococcaceae bacterium]|nr:FAD:protein FMN transferase [Oscillospiraceae bacterium]HBI54303.1 FAD:protein FMN transferase [Oscillospiraceae bacterium]